MALDQLPTSEGVPTASLETLVIMKQLAGRTQDLANIEAMLAAGADRELLRTAVRQALPDAVDLFERLVGNADRAR